MNEIVAVLYREYKLRTSNHLVMIFYDLFLPMAYLLVFGVGLAGLTNNEVVWHGAKVPYVSFVLAGVLAATSFGTAMSAAWGFFTDRDNGIFYEFLTYPMGRGQFLVGKILFNDLQSLGRSTLAVVVAVVVLNVKVQFSLFPLLLVGVVVGAAGWFFFLSVFALRIRRTDAFYTLMDLFYYYLLFASSVFYPVESMPAWLRGLALFNPITWQTDFLRYASLGVGGGPKLIAESAAFVVFTFICYRIAVYELTKKD